MRIALVGGGTGGHFYPLLAVAEQLQASPERPELFYFGPSPYDAPALQSHGIAHIWCPAGKVRRYWSPLNVLDGLKNIAGIFVAFVKLYWLYPDVIFSKGGYTSIPILLIGRFYRIPVVIHESDSTPGRANLLAKKFARYIAVSYDDAARFFPPEKTALTGIPIRSEILSHNPNAHATLGIPNDLPLLYITGGSSGADRINTLVLNALNELLPHYRIFHQTGTAHEATVTQTAQALITDPELLGRYYVRGTLSAEHVSALLDAATLVISRAGSTTIFEIALHGKPSILIPIPEGISHDQTKNAYAYARTGAASVLEEANLTENILANEVASIVTNSEKYQAMHTAALQFAPRDAAAKIAAVLIAIGHEHGS